MFGAETATSLDIRTELTAIADLASSARNRRLAEFESLEATVSLGEIDLISRASECNSPRDRTSRTD